MIPPELESILESDPAKVHGAVSFRGTRVPLALLIDYVEDGCGLDDFLEDFPGVSREAAQLALSYLAGESRKNLKLAS